MENKVKTSYNMFKDEFLANYEAENFRKRRARLFEMNKASQIPFQVKALNSKVNIIQSQQPHYLYSPKQQQYANSVSVTFFSEQRPHFPP